MCFFEIIFENMSLPDICQIIMLSLVRQYNKVSNICLFISNKRPTVSLFLLKRF
jgi:hypothetical protein